ncbi:MAG: hypothetical protein ACFFCP_17245, partial [Promethearchaeota archaeon]
MKKCITKGVPIVLVILLCLPIINVTYSDYQTESQVIDTENQPELSDTDFDRVEWKLDHYPNPGFELWSDSNTPERLETSRTTESYRWFASAPWPVNEGSQSFGMQARAMNPYYESQTSLGKGWGSISNPVNLTLSFDWYVDELPDPVGNDSLIMEVYFPNPDYKYLNYHLASQPTSVSNTTTEGNFIIPGPTDTWNHLSRNLTADFIEVFSSVPNTFLRFTCYLTSRTTEYSRVFIDDVNLYNTTVLVGGSTQNGNFNSLGTWYTSSTDPSDISQCTDKQEGSWSLNATSLSNGNSSKTTATYDPYKVATALNKDIFTFQWKLNDLQITNAFNYAYIRVECRTYEGSSHYLRYKIGYTTMPLEIWGDGVDVAVDNYNTTGQWYTFNTSIWEDLGSYYTFSGLSIDSIELIVATNGVGHRLSVLIDNLTLTLAGLNDMGYETYSGVGNEVFAWSPQSGTHPEMTITDTAHSGTYAANVTVEDSTTFSEDQEFGYLPINNERDTWIDLYWRLEEFSALDYEYIYLEVMLDNDDSFAYIFANVTQLYTGNGFDDYILVDGRNSIGSWYNLRRNIFTDYVSLFGTEPDTTLDRFDLVVVSSSGGHIEFLLDDVYLYTDPAPVIDVPFISPS